jgi:type III secretion system FlhB-like substrate exporter
MVPKVIAACNEQIAQQLVDLFKKANTGILNKNLG